MTPQFQGRQSQGAIRPLTRALLSLLVVLIAVVAVLFGVVIIAIVIAIAIILLAFLSIRAWWLQRKLRLHVHPRHRRQHRDRGVTLEGEYTVEDSGKVEGDKHS